MAIVVALEDGGTLVIERRPGPRKTPARRPFGVTFYQGAIWGSAVAYSFAAALAGTWLISAGSYPIVPPMIAGAQLGLGVALLYIGLPAAVLLLGIPTIHRGRP